MEEVHVPLPSVNYGGPEGQFLPTKHQASRIGPHLPNVRLHVSVLTYKTSGITNQFSRTERQPSLISPQSSRINFNLHVSCQSSFAHPQSTSKPRPKHVVPPIGWLHEDL